MLLTPKLVGRLYRALKRDPGSVPDITFAGSDVTSWTIADEVLTLTVGASTTTWSLSAYTLMQLALALGSAGIGVTITGFPTAARQVLGAIVLVDGSSIAIAAGSPVILSGYTRRSWTFLDTAAKELTLARIAVEAAPAEIAVNTADGTWLDLQGTYYDIKRMPGETDASYSARIVFEITLPRGNNVSLAICIERYTGLACTVDDVTDYTPVEPSFDGVPKFDGTYDFNPVVSPIYGRYDVNLLTAASITAAQIAAIQTVVARVEGSGNGLRSINVA